MSRSRNRSTGMTRWAAVTRCAAATGWAATMHWAVATRWAAGIRTGIAGAAVILAVALPLQAQESPATIDLTLERMVELTLSTSYRVQYLNMSVEQTRQRLRAQSARLRSNVELDLSAPDFQSVSETQWNSNLGRNEIVHENSRRWEAELSVRQPVILFGYPTNGYLSLNNRMYRYTQIGENGERDINYYNRYFVRYTQPLFQPNSLKNSLEEAEMDFEQEEIDFYEDMVRLIDDAADDYYDLFEETYERTIRQEYVERLVSAEGIAQELAAADPDRALDIEQVQVELANAREQVRSAQSQERLQMARLRTDLNLPDSVTFSLDPVIELEPVDVDMDVATTFALELTGRMRELEIQRRENEISLEETRGRNAFRVDLEFTYGREARDPTFGRIWGEPSNTYTVDVNAYIPIWDWGERDARIQASQISLDRTSLRFEETRAQIESNIENEVRNVEELQERALSMQENLERAEGIAEESLARYEAGTISILDLLQALRRENDTAGNFLDAYMGWRQSLQRLQEMTYYDFETDMPILDRFDIDIDSVQEISGPRD